MRIEQITTNRKKFLDILLLADEQENMIDHYIERGDMFALYDNDEVKTVCIVTSEDEATYEIKNIATYEKDQKKGYGKRMIEYLFEFYKAKGKTMLVGTIESPSTLLFYERCGFQRSHRIKNFYLDHYDHPIVEDGVRMMDMIYLRKNF